MSRDLSPLFCRTRFHREVYRVTRCTFTTVVVLGHSLTRGSVPVSFHVRVVGVCVVLVPEETGWAGPDPTEAQSLTRAAHCEERYSDLDATRYRATEDLV